MHPRLPLLLAALAAAPALAPSTASATWSRAQTVTRAGSSSGVAVAADARGRLGISYVRDLGRTNRAELRRGTLRGGLGRPALLDSGRHAMDSTAVAFGPPRHGNAFVAWRRWDGGNHRLRGTVVRRDGTRRTARLTGPGSSAYDPAFLADGTLHYAYRADGAVRVTSASGYGAEEALPRSAGLGAVTARTGDGALVAAWTEDGRVRAALRPAGQGAFDAPVTFPYGGATARGPQLEVTPDGHVAVAWLSTRPGSRGTAVLAATRAPGGAFGAPVEVGTDAERAQSVRLQATSAGDLYVVWLATRSSRGWGDASGRPRLRRLFTGGRLGPPARDLAPDAAARHLRTATDPSGAFAAWRDGSGRLRAIRIAPGGQVGTPRTLVPRGTREHALAGVPTGGVVAAWSGTDGRIRWSLYRF